MSVAAKGLLAASHPIAVGCPVGAFGTAGRVSDTDTDKRLG